MGVTSRPISRMMTSFAAAEMTAPALLHMHPANTEVAELRFLDMMSSNRRVCRAIIDPGTDLRALGSPRRLRRFECNTRYDGFSRYEERA
jgi:hypothetical protein